MVKNQTAASGNASTTIGCGAEKRASSQQAEENRREAFDTVKDAVKDAVKKAVANPEEVIRVAESEPCVGQKSLRDEAAQRAFRQAYERAVRYLGQREHSEKELLSKLCARDADTAVAREVVAELKALDLQSDHRFAESLLRSRVSRGKGPLVIRQELGRKGIDDELVDEVLTLSGDYWVEVAAGARDKRFGPQLPEDRSEWSRQARFLARRGFPSDLIYRVLGNLA